MNKGGYSRGAPNRSNKTNGFFSPYGNPRLEDGPVGEYLTDRQTDEAIKFIEDKKDRPFFVYLSYYAVHNPMQAKEEHIKYFQSKSDSMDLSTSEGSPTTNLPLRAGKGWLYEVGIRVPLIIKAPGFMKKSAIINVPVSTIDYFPTILEMTGSSSNNIKTDGVSILPVLKAGKIKNRPLYWHYPHYSNQGGDPGSAVRIGNFKLIDNFETGRQELYNLKNI